MSQFLSRQRIQLRLPEADSAERYTHGPDVREIVGGIQEVLQDIDAASTGNTNWYVMNEL